jgi:DNA-binding MarR family transcriptional regulator
VVAGSDASQADSQLMDVLVETSFLIQAMLTQVADQYGLTVGQLRLLGVLRDRRPGMTELGAHLGLDRSSTTGLVDRAEKRRLVSRTSDPDDGRATRVAMTATGRRLVAKAEAEVLRGSAVLTAGLTGRQRRELLTLLGSVRDQAAQGRSPGEP